MNTPSVISTMRPAIVLVLFFTLVTGVVLPLAVTGVATAVFPSQANGSLIRKGDQVIGSALIGQNFTQDKYFRGRPSATTDTDPNDATRTIAAPYNGGSSGGSNLGPTSQALVDRVKADVAKAGPAPVPADAVTTSASGLDPDISPANADRQVARVAKARNVPVERVQALLDAHTARPVLGFIGQARVNVLEVNMALDAMPANVTASK